MAVTVIRAVANMRADISLFLGKRGTAAPPNIDPIVSDDIRVDSFDIRGDLDYPIPWCRSADEFNNLHLSLDLRRPYGSGYGRTTTSIQRFVIWQQDTGGEDRVRFSLDGQFHPNALPLAADRNGAPYIPRSDADVILWVDDRQWVILTRIP
jgi:hypothetical protein